jgi:hypothetical protein
VEISTLAIQLQIRHDSNPATVTPLLHWLSTKHNLIDLAKKVFPASDSKSTSKKVKNTQSEIANMNDGNINRGFKNLVPKD